MTFRPQGDARNPYKRISLHDLIPVREENRDRIKALYGGDAQVRFSISEQQDTDYLQAVESGDMEKAYTIC